MLRAAPLASRRSSFRRTEDPMAAAPTSHPPVVTLDDVARGEFLVRVYQHLLAALLAFLAFEALLFNLGAAESLYDLVAGSGATWPTQVWLSRPWMRSDTGTSWWWAAKYCTSSWSSRNSSGGTGTRARS